MCPNFDWNRIFDEMNHPATGSNEMMVCNFFVKPLLASLGFADREYYQNFPTGTGAGKADFAARKNINESDLFFQSRLNPDLIIEVKPSMTARGDKRSLAENTPLYKKTKDQLIRYLKAPNCQNTRWGIITNVDYLQLFRKHGKVVVPVTSSMIITSKNIANILTKIKVMIADRTPALIICTYNNKGGVGKTTTCLNLASIFAQSQKKVLLVDFDSQADLTTYLKLDPKTVTLSECLVNPELNIKDTIVPFVITRQNKKRKLFDVIPADQKLESYTNSHEVSSKVEKGIEQLSYLLKNFQYDYDYIIIDVPTNWIFFSQSALMVADVVLIPTKHSDLNSIRNSARVITEFIPEIKKQRKDGGPTVLPIFFNGETATDASLAIVNKEIENMIKQNPSLQEYYWPNYQAGSQDTTIYLLPKYAAISSSAFNHLPAACRNKQALECYQNFAQHYFLDI